MTWEKPNLVKESNTPPIAKTKIGTVNETDKPHVSKGKRDKSSSNESDKVRSLDKSSSLYKSRSTQGTETEDIVKTLAKSRSISSASFFDKITKIENPKEIKYRKDYRSDSCNRGEAHVRSNKMRARKWEKNIERIEEATSRDSESGTPCKTKVDR